MTHVLLKDKGDGRTKGNSTPKKTFAKDDTPKKEKTDAEKEARKAEKALRDKQKQETRQAQLLRSNDRKTKEDELKKKKEATLSAAQSRAEGQFSHLFSNLGVTASQQPTLTPEEELEDEEVNRILEKVESGDLDDDDEIMTKKKTKKRALNEGVPAQQ